MAADSRRSRSASQASPTLACVTTSKVRARATTSCSSANGSSVPPQPARRPSHPLGDQTQLAVVRREHRQDAVGLAKVEVPQHDRGGLVQAWRWHPPSLPAHDGAPGHRPPVGTHPIDPRRRIDHRRRCGRVPRTGASMSRRLAGRTSEGPLARPTRGWCPRARCMGQPHGQPASSSPPIDRRHARGCLAWGPIRASSEREDAPGDGSRAGQPRSTALGQANVSSIRSQRPCSGHGSTHRRGAPSIGLGSGQGRAVTHPIADPSTRSTPKVARPMQPARGEVPTARDHHPHAYRGPSRALRTADRPALAGLGWLGESRCAQTRSMG